MMKRQMFVPAWLAAERDGCPPLTGAIIRLVIWLVAAIRAVIQ